uniref:stromal interaction molecule 1-like isoform X2 n=1 Tax=Myxine glutinosa TaxID=7769 RepID=UPI00358E1799
MRPGRAVRAFWFATFASLIATMSRTADITDVVDFVDFADFPERERESYEALQGIHSLMDDDRDGSVDRQESHEFLREDLQCSDPSARHSSFHGEDSAVSFAEMWEAWRASEVYKWTSDDVLRWVEETVELPQYLELFRDNNISGPHLPQLAASNQTLLTGLLHITDRSHRHKLQLKALDVVLFGPPPATHSPVKDAILVAAVVAGLGAGWVAFLQSKRWRRHVQRMELELESLQQAEESLIELQNKLSQAEEEQRNVESEKRSLETRLRTRFERMRAAGGGSENKELGVNADEKYKGGEGGAEQLRASLHRAEKELAMLRESSIPTPALRPWLQLTFELEEEQGALQRKLAEQRLFSARELAERIRRKQHSVLGSFFVAHSVSLDLVDNQILETKQCLAELMSCLRERATRWQEIERLCGFSITQNPGKTALRSMLYDNGYL